MSEMNPGSEKEEQVLSEEQEVNDSTENKIEDPDMEPAGHNEDSDFFYDDDESYEARRDQRLKRLGRRKRRRRIRHIAEVCVLVLAVAVGLAAGLYGDELKVMVKDQQNRIIQMLHSSEKEEQNNTEKETGSSEVSADKDNTSDPEVTPEPELSKEDKKIYKQAKHYAQQYDYDQAISLLKSSSVYDTNEKFQKAAGIYQKKKDSCVSWPLDQVTHIFYHSLIVDTARAFDGDYKQGDYDQVMTTMDEFNKITQAMYDKGYVMVSIYDMARVDENGNMTEGEILLPPGKIPFVLSQDDVCYYHYMDGDGFASRLIVDEEGKVRNEYVEEDGSVSVGDYDVVPLIDRFVEEHPDFSYRGAKGIVSLTGYNGILGYRSDSSYETRPADLDANKVQWLDEHPDFDIEKEKEGAARVAQAMKDEGWLFASHTWGHLNVGEISLERLQADTQRFKENVDPLIGGTDIIIFAFGTDLTQAEDYSGEKFDYLKSQGYNYYCNVDSRQYFVQIRDNYFRQGRRNVDGYRMYYNPELLTDLFDATAVFDPVRPVPVPKMGSR
ncbi:MAG: polysaccharide deacetylase [Clostridia bacterium]|nr:polysaccharide deacetylase [Clostridia bacterium]MDY5555518.1 polysaccharide deacetylase [Blautia sp.]